MVKYTKNMDAMGSCIWMNEFEILDSTLDFMILLFDFSID